MPMVTVATLTSVLKWPNLNFVELILIALIYLEDTSVSALQVTLVIQSRDARESVSISHCRLGHWKHFKYFYNSTYKLLLLTYDSHSNSSSSPNGLSLGPVCVCVRMKNTSYY